MPSKNAPRSERAPAWFVVTGLVGLTGLVPTSACLVNDAGVPSTAKLLCGSTDDCPSGWTCEIDVALCLSPDAPRLDGAPVLSTLIAGPLREVRIAFAFDRNVVRDDVKVALVDARREAVAGGGFARVDGDAEHVFALLPTGVIEGEHLIEIVGVSDDGVTGRFVAGPIIVDATPPLVDDEAGQRATFVTPSLANATTVVTGGFSANEALGGPAEDFVAPTFRVVHDVTGAEEIVSGTLVGGSDARFELAPDPARAEGSYSVFIASFVDRAGNAGDTDDDVARVGTFTLDFAPPDVTFVEVTPEVITPAGEEHVLSVCVTVVDENLPQGAFDLPEGARPFTLTVADVDVSTRCAAADAPCTHACVVDVATDLPGAVTPDEGPVLVAVTARDLAGNVRTTATAVVWDERAPEIVNPFSWIEPGPGNVLFAPTSMTNGSTLVVAFNTDEPVRGQPDDGEDEDPTVTLTCAGGVQLPAERQVPFASTFFLYRARLLPGVVVDDGACTLDASVTDRVGNATTRSLDELGPVLVDRSAPDASPIVVDELVHLRAPWGMILGDATPGTELTTPFQALIDAQGNEVISGDLFAVPGEEIVMVRIWDAAVGEGSEIGRTERAVDDGGALIEPVVFPIPAFATRDAPAIWVSVTDAAGNDSARVRVPHGQWVTTTGAQSTWALDDNPTALLVTPFMTAALFPPSLVPLRYPDPVIGVDAGLGNTESAIARAALIDLEGAATFERLRGRGAPTPFPVVMPAVSADPTRGRVLLFGGAREDRLTDALWELDGPRAIGRCSSLVEPCFWKRPPPRVGAAMVFEPRRARTVLTGGCIAKNSDAVASCTVVPEGWLFDGSAWNELPCDDALCAALLTRHRHALAVDGKGGLASFGGCTNAACTTLSDDVFLLVDDVITEVCDDGVVGCTGTPPSPRADAGLAFDGDRVVVFGGCGAYSGAIPWACTDPLADLYSLDLTTRVWTKHVVPPGIVDDCARGSLASVVDDALDGGEDATILAACAASDGPPSFARIALPDVIATTLVGAGDDFDFDPDEAQVLFDPTLVVTIDPTRERFLAVGEHAATALARVGGDFMFAGRIIEEVTESPPAGDQRAIVAVPSGEVLHVSVEDGVRATWASNGAHFRLVCTGCGPSVIDAAAPVPSGPLAGAVVVGGGNVWRYTDDGSPNPWVQLATVPPATDNNPTLISDDNGGALLLGSAGGALVASRLTNAGFGVPLDTSATAMSVRRAVGGVFAPARDAIVVFGGCDGLLCTPLDDTYEVSVSGGALVTDVISTTTTPAPRRSPILNVDPERGRVVMFGGLAGTTSVRDGAWELDVDTWHARSMADPEADGEPTGDLFGTSAADVRNGGVIFTDGSDASGAASLWRYDGAASRRPAHIVVTSFLASGVPDDTPVDLVFVRVAGGGTSPIADGARLLAWRGTRWSTIGATVGSASEPDVAFGFLGDDGNPDSDDFPVEPFFFDPTRALAFALVPLPNATGQATLTSTYAEIHVRYTLP
jgi:hypothetical protein